MKDGTVCGNCHVSYTYDQLLVGVAEYCPYCRVVANPIVGMVLHSEAGKAAREVRESEIRMVAALRQRVAELEAKLREVGINDMVHWRSWREEAERLLDEQIATRQRAEAAEAERDQLRADNRRLLDALDAKGYVLSRDGKLLFCEGCGEYDVETVESVAADRDQLKAENAEYWRAATALMNVTDDNPEDERQALNSLNSIRTGNSYAHMGPPVVEWLAKERDRAQVELAALRAACQPFLERGIPENWPGECVLTFNGLWGETYGKRQGTYVSYLAVQDQGAPTIADWRRLAELVPAEKADLYAAFQRRLAEDGGVWPETTGDGR